MEKNVTVKKGFPMIIRIIIGVVFGAALGFAYYKFVGCSSGACPITKNPYISSLFGALIGALFAMR